MIKNLKIVLILLNLTASLLFFSQCSPEQDRTGEEIEVDEIPLKVTILRFEQDLFAAKTPSEILALEKKYPDFYPVYMYQIMEGISSNASTPPEEAARNLMNNFTTIPDFGLWLKLRCDSVFGDFSEIETELTNAMKRYHHYFPKDTIPTFITFLSPLVINFPVIEGKHQMGIGLDMYLGSDFKPYHSYKLADNFPNYRIRKMRRDYLVRDLVTGMGETRIPRKKDQTRLIDEMIMEGKLLYLVDALLPDLSDSIKLGYTPEQLNWASENEREIWAALVDSKMLYSTDPMEIRDFINDGPFTTAKGFGAGTAPRAGAFIGYRIIQKYMAKHPEVTLPDLLKNEDTDQILTGAKYKG